MRLLLLALCLATCAPVAPTSPSPNSTATSPTPDAPTPAPSPTASPAVITGPQRSVVTFYRTEDVVRGSAQPSKRLDVAAPIYDLRFGPDPRWAITTNFGGRAPLRMLDLETGVITNVALDLPADALPVRSVARWLPDGTLLLGGREIWVSGPRGEDPKSVFGRFPYEVAPSPTGKLLAISTLESAEIVVLELASGKMTTLRGPFRPCAQDGGLFIVWARDETAVAATDCSDAAQTAMQTRVVRITDGREIRNLPGLTTLAWLPSGELIARGPLGRRGEPEERWVVAADGTRRAIPSVGFYPSPDGRFLLGSVGRDAPTSADPARRVQFAQLVEVSTGRVLDVGEGMPAGWTSRGEIALISLF